jgi:hypothetical protein
LENGTRSKICRLAILLTLLPVISYAQNQNYSAARELYAKSGLEKQIAQFPPLIQTFLDQSVREEDQTQKLPRDVLWAIRKCVPEAFAPEKLEKTVLAEFTAKLSDQDIKEVLLWLDSPTGKRFTHLEEESSTVEAQFDMQQYAAGLRDSPPSAERLKALRELDSAVKGTDGSVEMTIAAQVAVALAFNSTLPQEQQKPMDEIARETEKTRPLLEAEVRSQMLISYLYTYRSMTESQIRQYTEFARSPSGSRYSAVAMAAFKKSYLEGAARWGKLIGDAIKELKGGSEARMKERTEC